MKQPKITMRKWNGDDSYSWAVFRSDQRWPLVTGCERREARYHKKQIEDMLRRKKHETENDQRI